MASVMIIFISNASATHTARSVFSITDCPTNPITNPASIVISPRFLDPRTSPQRNTSRRTGARYGTHAARPPGRRTSKLQPTLLRRLPLLPPSPGLVVHRAGCIVPTAPSPGVAQVGYRGLRTADYVSVVLEPRG